LQSFYRPAKGFLGWGTDLLAASREYVPGSAADMGGLPARGVRVRLEVPLDRVGAAGQLLDDVAFLHNGGRVLWGRTSLLDAGRAETIIWGDTIGWPTRNSRR
jgi:hypothetical protein